MMAAQFSYTPKALELQKRFDTEALAAAELAVIVHNTLTPPDRGFIESSEYFFLSTVDPSGSPTVSYKGGAPGFVKMTEDGQNLMFPCFDGNGMYFSMGNIAHTSKIGMLFISFTTPARLRVQGTAELTDDKAIVGLWPGAQFAVKMKITALITNCPRYIPRMDRVEGSRYVPDAKTGAQPIPGWKRIDAIQAVLPKRDQNKADTVGGLISMDQWGDMVAKGNPLA
jgi:uncharacterized protein